VAAVTAAIQNLEYHAPPEVVFESDQWHIRALIAARKDELTQLYGSQLDRPTAMENKLIFVNHTFPNGEKLVLDKALAGYRGCLSFIEDSFNTK
jgi:nitrogenase molybdenum-iron protein beta chain